MARLNIGITTTQRISLMLFRVYTLLVAILVALANDALAAQYKKDFGFVWTDDGDRGSLSDCILVDAEGNPFWDNYLCKPPGYAGVYFHTAGRPNDEELECTHVALGSRPAWANAWLCWKRWYPFTFEFSQPSTQPKPSSSCIAYPEFDRALTSSPDSRAQLCVKLRSTTEAYAVIDWLHIRLREAEQKLENADRIIKRQESIIKTLSRTFARGIDNLPKSLIAERNFLDALREQLELDFDKRYAPKAPESGN